MGTLCIGWFKFKKKSGERNYLRGDKVWLVNKKVVTLQERKKDYFGEVTKDSLWPNQWAEIQVYDKVWWGKHYKEFA